MATTLEKLRIAKDDLNKDVEKYIDLWVAVDDKDRIIAYDKDRAVVFKQAYNFDLYAQNCGFRVYRIYKPYIRQMIKSLLDHNF